MVCNLALREVFLDLGENISFMDIDKVVILHALILYNRCYAINSAIYSCQFIFSHFVQCHFHQIVYVDDSKVVHAFFFKIDVKLIINLHSPRYNTIHYLGLKIEPKIVWAI